VNRNRNESIDSLRGFSALLVVMAHIWTIGVPKGAVEKAIELSVFRNGFYGVSIFFVISGFLITKNILVRYQTVGQVNLKQFYTFRIARIVPLLLLLLGVLWLLAFLNPELFAVLPPYNIEQMTIAALTFRYNQYHILHGSPILPWGILWSLSVEEMFYLFYPVLCKISGLSNRLVLLLIAAICTSLYLRASGTAIHATSVCMGQLAIGALTALAAANPHVLKILVARSRLFLWLGITVLVVTNFSKEFTFSATAIALGASLIIMGCLNPQRSARKFPLSKGLQNIGIYSYEIYMIHGVIIWSLKGDWTDSLGPFASDLLVVGILASNYLIAWAISNFYAEPLNRLIRRILVRDSEKGKGNSIKAENSCV